SQTSPLFFSQSSSVTITTTQSLVRRRRGRQNVEENGDGGTKRQQKHDALHPEIDSERVEDGMEAQIVDRKEDENLSRGEDLAVLSTPYEYVLHVVPIERDGTVAACKRRTIL
ncbi:hypothetical protein PIB30_081849, partial [Stylosanthes scabra]|nr:hypothetical protein [Stylosanthes scabra]